jgi:beta-glucosidase
MQPFLWGTATSSHQIEGYNQNNDWWAWEQAGNIEGGAASGPATDHWNRYKEDLKLAAALGLNSYRFSIEWSRLEPEEGKWDDSAFEWYNDLISECERNNLVPMLTLHHFTSPLWFAGKGGFASELAPKRFSTFVKMVAARLGARVPLWCTINEPMVLAVGGYLARLMPPAIQDGRVAASVCRNLLSCHALAYDILHATTGDRLGPWRTIPLQVGIAHNMIDFIPDRFWHPMERLLTYAFNRFYNTAWLRAITGQKQCFGIPFIVPSPPQVPEALGRVTADFIGINYYTKAYVQWKPRSEEPISDFPVNLKFHRKHDTVSDMGWAIHPQGLSKVIRLAQSYRLPIYITENGIADREDKLRTEYIRSHIQELRLQMKDGVDIRGYYYWSLLDNFEWIKGFHPRFGLYHVDYDTFERSLRPSGRAFRQIIQSDD